jgi:hypothetical protein
MRNLEDDKLITRFLYITFELSLGNLFNLGIIYFCFSESVDKHILNEFI